MASLGVQMFGSSLALLGWVGVILTSIMPMWRVTAFIGMTIVTSETMWEGIWMACVMQSTGHIQCKPYDSMLALSSDLKAAQVLTVGSILTGALGLILAFIGGKCTRFMDYKSVAEKARIATAAGVTLIITGLLCLIPVSWTAVSVVQMFYNPHITDSQRREIGAAIYIGWGATILLFLGGGMLCSTSCMLKPEDERQSVKYITARSFKAGSRIRGLDQIRMSNPAYSVLMRSQQSDLPPSNQQQVKTTSEGSNPSKTSTTNCQPAIEKPMTESERSVVPSTKSQLSHAGSDQSLPASQLSESASNKLEKTYI